MTAEPHSEAEEVAGASTAPTAYTIVLPPAWQKIPVRQGTEKAVRAIVDQAFANLPKDIPRDKVTPYRIELERQLSGAARRARQNGGTELYLPVELMHGTLIPASFVVSEGAIGSAEELDPAAIISHMAAEDNGNRTVTIDGAIGVRTEHTARPNPDAGIDQASRRVDYVLSVPGNTGRWLVIAFSALGAGDPEDKFATLLVELFDAIMSTFRWARV